VPTVIEFEKHWVAKNTKRLLSIKVAKLDGEEFSKPIFTIKWGANWRTGLQTELL